MGEKKIEETNKEGCWREMSDIEKKLFIKSQAINTGKWLEEYHEKLKKVDRVYEVYR